MKIFYLFLFLVVSSCGSEKLSNLSQDQKNSLKSALNGFDSVEQSVYLAQANQGQPDNINASGKNEAIRGMAKDIVKGDCTFETPNTEIMSTSLKVTGDGCPISFEMKSEQTAMPEDYKGGHFELKGSSAFAFKVVKDEFKNFADIFEANYNQEYKVKGNIEGVGDISKTTELFTAMAPGDVDIKIEATGKGLFKSTQFGDIKITSKGIGGLKGRVTGSEEGFEGTGGGTYVLRFELSDFTAQFEFISKDKDNFDEAMTFDEIKLNGEVITKEEAREYLDYKRFIEG